MGHLYRILRANIRTTGAASRPVRSRTLTPPVEDRSHPVSNSVYAIYKCSKTILYTNLAVSILSAAGFAVAAAFQIPKMASITVGRPLFGCWSEVRCWPLWDLIQRRFLTLHSVS